MRSSLHSHHAWQLMVGREGPVRIRQSSDAEPFAAGAVLTHPNVPHAAEADGTSLLGAVYLTAYLGGAVATHFRVGSPLPTHVLFPVYVATFVWGGLALRSPRLVSLLLGNS